MDKKQLWAFIIKLLLSLLTAAATALGVTSCMAVTGTIKPAPDSIVARIVQPVGTLAQTDCAE